VRVPIAADAMTSVSPPHEQHRTAYGSDAELWCIPEYVVERGVAADKILEVATQSQVNWSVLGVRQPGGFPGVATNLPIAIARKVVPHALCPVLTVRG
jgi:hypothetical protein